MEELETHIKWLLTDRLDAGKRKRGTSKSQILLKGKTITFLISKSALHALRCLPVVGPTRLIFQTCSAGNPQTAFESWSMAERSKRNQSIRQIEIKHQTLCSSAFSIAGKVVASTPVVLLKISPKWVPSHLNKQTNKQSSTFVIVQKWEEILGKVNATFSPCIYLQKNLLNSAGE